jgi:hypothetical protein
VAALEFFCDVSAEPDELLRAEADQALALQLDYGARVKTLVQL